MITNTAYNSNNQQVNNAKQAGRPKSAEAKLIILAVIFGAIPQVLNFIARCFFHVDMMLPSAGIGFTIFTIVYFLSISLCILAMLLTLIVWLAKLQYRVGRKVVKTACKYFKIKF